MKRNSVPDFLHTSPTQHLIHSIVDVIFEYNQNNSLTDLLVVPGKRISISDADLWPKPLRYPEVSPGLPPFATPPVRPTGKWLGLSNPRYKFYAPWVGLSDCWI